MVVRLGLGRVGAGMVCRRRVCARSRRVMVAAQVAPWTVFAASERQDADGQHHDCNADAEEHLDPQRHLRAHSTDVTIHGTTIGSVG